jgi:hypothetical protein
MPVVTCLLSAVPEGLDADAVVRAWSSHTGIASDDMTINFVPTHQGGRSYGAMAWLHIPSFWSDGEGRRLADGLASALVECLALTPTDVLVVTTIVEPALILDPGLGSNPSR